jgi:hypothetical protein
MITATLTSPLTYFNTTLTKLRWTMTYPDNVAYYQLTTSEDLVLKDGQCFIDDAVVQSWGADDSIITNAIVNAAPWNINI